MSNSIDTAMIDAFGTSTKLAYQQMGAELQFAVQVVNDVNAATYRFKTLGKGVATTKGRHGIVPIMGLQHGGSTATLIDRYGAELLDDLDEFKQNEATRQNYSMSIAAALGRETDQIIIAAWGATANTIADVGNLGLTKDRVMSVRETMNFADVSKRDRFAIVGPRQSTELMSIEEFVNSRYQPNFPLVQGSINGKEWLGFTWLEHTGLPITLGAEDYRQTYFVHKAASGLAVGKGITMREGYLIERDSTMVLGKMSMGATIIDPPGIYELECREAE